MGLGATMRGGSSWADRIHDEIVGKEEEDAKGHFFPISMAQFLSFLHKVLLVGTICENFDYHGGQSSFNCYVYATVEKACHNPPKVVVLADAYIREHLHFQSAAGKHFENAAEADKMSDRLYERARREVAAKYGEAEKGKRTTQVKAGKRE